MSNSFEILKQIDELPSSKQLYLNSQSLAILDAILSPEWQYRYFSFNQHWDDGQSMASLRDGCGAHYFILLFHAHDHSDYGAIGKLYDSALGLSDKSIDSNGNNNKEVRCFLNESAFINDESSLYFYQFNGTKRWTAVPELKNIPLLGFLSNKEAAYYPWAKNYYETNIDLQTVTDIFAHKPLTVEMINKLNPLLDIDQLRVDITEIGYPVDFN